MGVEETMDERAPEPTGAQLRRAREAASLSLADVAATTRIRTSHLQALEDGDLAALPGRTYAIGFARTYAKAVGLDDALIARGIRRDLGDAAAPDSLGTPAFTPGDPARVPTARFAWIAAAAAIVLAAGGFAYWHTSQSPSASLPSLLPEPTPAPAVVPAPAPVPAPVAAANGPVVFTALASGVVVKLVDGAGQPLLQKQLAQGESFAIPADANRPMLTTSSPEALSITIGGQPVAKLAESHVLIDKLEVSSAALLARPAAGAVAKLAPVAPVMAGAVAATGAAAAEKVRRPIVRPRKPGTSAADSGARLGGILPPAVEAPKPAEEPAAAKPAVATP